MIGLIVKFSVACSVVVFLCYKVGFDGWFWGDFVLLVGELWCENGGYLVWVGNEWLREWLRGWGWGIWGLGNGFRLDLWGFVVDLWWAGGDVVGYMWGILNGDWDDLGMEWGWFCWKERTRKYKKRSKLFRIVSFQHLFNKFSTEFSTVFRSFPQSFPQPYW